ncbi:TetR family transcriptional regulator [Blastococcus sp. MG754426]|uniref:TetR/AcrR family transcriptional regulator C-terminal domain-containing protein n=1 Tax=unclassified Blastococcus TaxID=2619396 RepID=UPI001EF04AF6|nr:MULTISPECIES: TetR/AcrR family transcriptional regulator C-terminal domain-containing protein [unclassified Blastococcus]MCF6508396.1 TetR family transcriptional regulator [Blastococcus sp. MG754426]MCF6513012.1 TetR family transcriptional regulator [Blastococcus sp. MG754427]
MAPRTDVAARSALTRRRVLQAAVDLADREGLPALTMRRLAQDLDVEAMSLYHHVANKEAVLDGVVEVVVGEIVGAVAGVGPDAAVDWRGALRARILTARRVLLRHPWAPAVIETRTAMNAEVIGYFDGLLGILRAGGFSYDLAHHAMHALGSRALGFTRELFAPADPETGGEEAMAMLEQLADVYPHLAGMLADTAHRDDGVLGWCDDQAEFEFALDLLLDGLDRRLARG